MSPDPARQKELGRQLDQRRRELRHSYASLARLAGLSVDTVRAVIRGTNAPRDTTAAGLETALGLRAGWIADYLAGVTGEVEVTDDRPKIVRDHWRHPLVQVIWNAPPESEGGPSRDARIGTVTVYVNQFLPAEMAGHRAS